MRNSQSRWLNGKVIRRIKNTIDGFIEILFDKKHGKLY